MYDLKSLWELQVLEEQKKVLEIEMKGGQISKDLKNLKKDIESGRRSFDALKDMYSNNKKDLKTKELELISTNHKIKDLGEKLYDGSITSAKEVDSSSKKLAMMQNMVERIEDDMLAMMEKSDELRSRLSKVQAELGTKAEEYRRLHGTLLAHQQRARQRLAHTPVLRQKLLDQLAPELWHKYMEMKKRFSDPVARLEKGICLGCRVAIPFNDLRLLKEGNNLVFCNNCGRMLFWER